MVSVAQDASSSTETAAGIHEPLGDDLAPLREATGGSSDADAIVSDTDGEDLQEALRLSCLTSDEFDENIATRIACDTMLSADQDPVNDDTSQQSQSDSDSESLEEVLRLSLLPSEDFDNQVQARAQKDMQGASDVELEEVEARIQAIIFICTIGDIPAESPEVMNDLLIEMQTLESLLALRNVKPSDNAKFVSLLAQGSALLERLRYSVAYHVTALGASQVEQAMEEGDVFLLDQGVATLREAHELARDGHPIASEALNNLAIALRTRFEQSGDLEDLRDAIQSSQLALDLTPDGHSERPSRLSTFCSTISTRFQRFGDMDDIDRAIESQHLAVRLTPDDHPSLPGYLTNLGTMLALRFSRLDDPSDVGSAIDFHRRAVELTLDSLSAKASRLSNLGVAIQARYDRFEEQKDLDESVEVFQLATDLSLDSNPDKPDYLNNLGGVLCTRFEKHRQVGDLERAIAVIQRAIDLSPREQQGMSAYFHNLSSALKSRFYHFGRPDDLESAIACQRRAIQLTPDDHPDKAKLLDNLGQALLDRFQRFGDLKDIADAVTTLHRAVDTTPNDHPDFPIRLVRIGEAFEYRFRQLQEPEDIEAAVESMRKAVAFSRMEGTELSIYLGSALELRFKYFGNVDDLEEAVALEQAAIDDTSDDDPYKPEALNLFGNVLEARFGHFGEAGDLEKAISSKRRAVELTTEDNPELQNYLHNLGNSLITRFQRFEELGDIEEAISFLKRAVDLTPEGSPVKSHHLFVLGSAYLSHYNVSNLASAFKASYEHLLEAADQEMSEPSHRLDAAKVCCEMVQGSGSFFPESESLLYHAFERALSLIPQVVWLGQKVGRRYEELVNYGGLATSAAAMAIAIGEFTRAVEWMEEGRSIVWGQILQLRNPIDDLQKQHPELAEELKTTARSLERASNVAASALLTVDEDDYGTNARDEVSYRLSLAQKYSSLLAQIRAQAGFEDFLLPRKISALTAACRECPVVMLNVHQTRCDALFLSSSGRIIHIPLPKLTQEIAESMRVGLIESLSSHQLRGPATLKSSGQMDIVTLEYLWSSVIEPVLAVIRDELPCATGKLPRVTWCATGPLTFLPLHAAGDYTSPSGKKAFNAVVSSYTPSLSALIRPTAAPAHAISRSSTILVVSQPETLPSVDREVAIIKARFAVDSITHLDRAHATADAVLSELEAPRAPQIIHLACHGVQDPDDATKSAFVLAGGRLELARLMAKSTDGTLLAVLSACETAAGDAKLPEEVVHLTAGMLAVGYRAVVGTMWSIYDDDAPDIVDELYARLQAPGGVDESGSSGHMQTAYALHESVAKLRGVVGEQNIVRWAPYVHFGL